MNLLDDYISTTVPRLCKVDKDFMDFLRKHDYRVSVKDNRVFVGLAVYINSNLYLIPLTSTTNAKRIANNKKPRPKSVITKIIVGDEEIADLLYNNMIPVLDEYVTDIIINSRTDTYLRNEERFIRKNWVKINKKAMTIYLNRYNESHRDYEFLKKICCDFKSLEEIIKTYRVN